MIKIYFKFLIFQIFIDDLTMAQMFYLDSTWKNCNDNVIQIVASGFQNTDKLITKGYSGTYQIWLLFYR